MTRHQRTRSAKKFIKVTEVRNEFFSFFIISSYSDDYDDEINKTVPISRYLKLLRLNHFFYYYICLGN